MYHAHGRKHTHAVAGKPDAVKAACPVWWGVHGTGPSPRWYLAGCLPNGDIASCFDKLSHELLLETLSERIHDGRFLRLMRALLDAGYMEDWTWNKTLSGVPQGGILSPLLSNILLDKLDRFVETVLIPRHTKGVKKRVNNEYHKLITGSHQYRRRGNVQMAAKLREQAQKLPSIDTQDPDYRRLKYVRYADDFLLGFVGPRSEAEEIKRELREYLRDELQLELSEEKTLITHAKSEAARFLGYEVTVQHLDTKRTQTKRKGDRRSINGRIGLRVPHDVIEAKCHNYLRGGKAVHRAELTMESDFTIITTYQLEFRGLANYYRLAYNLHRLNRLKQVMEISLTKTLAHKFQVSVPAIYGRYGATLEVDCKSSSPAREKAASSAVGWGVAGMGY